MGFLKGITKIACSPIKGVAEIYDDLAGENDDEAQGLSILTCGISSIAKGTIKGVKSGVDEIFDD